MSLLKSKVAIKLFKSNSQLKQRPYWGNHFWARGYFASAVGLDEEMIQRYVKYQEKEEKRMDDPQLRFEF